MKKDIIFGGSWFGDIIAGFTKGIEELSGGTGV
jgi:hypothetical protein